MENPDIFDLRFINYYCLFLCGLCAFVAQTTVLIGVNPCLTESDLKKQSQFFDGQNDVKSILTMVYGDFCGPRLRENKANSKPNKANLLAFSGQRHCFVIPVKTGIQSCSWFWIPHRVRNDKPDGMF